MLTISHATMEETAMRVADSIRCSHLSCTDVRRSCLVPSPDIDPAAVSILLISEAAPVDPADYYYAGANALFARTTLLAFQEAGADVQTMQDILDVGVYLTTAVKCAKATPKVERSTVEACSHLLEREIALFPNVKVYLLMGDTAIGALNMIAKRAGDPRPVPAGSTYKIRGGEFTFRGARVLASYVQAGPALFVEKSKRRMIAQDIRQALDLTAGTTGSH
jgi:uracil-DNA glycosylase